MALTLEITRPDGVIETRMLNEAHARFDAQAGDTFRILDMQGQPIAGLSAIREGDDLVIDGLPDVARLELCDFYKPGDDDLACVLNRPDAQAVLSAGAEPVMLAQNTAATKTDAMMDKAADTAVDAKAEAAGKAGEAKDAMTEKAGDMKAGMTEQAADAEAGVAEQAADAKAGVAEQAGDAKAGMAGQAADTEAAAAAPASGDSAAAATTTAEQTAGTVTVEEAAANPSMRTGAIALGALGVIGIAAAAGGGSDDDDTPTTPVQTPTAAPAGTLEGGDLNISAAEASNGFTVSGTAEAGSTVVVMLGTATVQTIAAADGTFSAEFDGSMLPADGTYPMSVTATGPGENRTPATTELGQVTVAVNGANLNSTDAGSATLSGFDGNDVLVGGNEIAVANGNFQTWDLSGYHASNAGQVYDPTASPGGNSSIQIDADTDATGSQPGLGGWQVTFGNTPGGSSAITTVADVGRNGNEESTTPGSAGTFGRLEFITNTASPGSYVWETVTSEVSGGGGLTQTLSTVAGQDYSLAMDAIAPSGTGTPSDAHATGGTSVEIRWAGETVAFFDATANAGAGAWVTTNGLVAPTEDGDRWTFANLDATTGSTELSIIAYERWDDGTPVDAFDDGAGLRIGNIAVSGNDGSAEQTISGGAGRDLIFGQGGNDTIYGGAQGAADADADMFVYSMASDNGTDRVMDFTVGTDKIMLVEVSNTDTTGSLFMGDTYLNTQSIGGPEGAADSATGETANSSNNLTAADLLVSGEQSIAVSESAGNTMLTFTGAGNEALGSVTLVGVIGQVGADDAASVNNLISNGILDFTGNAFNTQLNAIA